MNKFILFSAIMVFFSFTLPAQAYRIEVQIFDLNEQVLRLGKHSGPDNFIVDSAYTDAEGVAVFEKDKKLEHGVYFIVLPSSAYFDILIGEDQDFYVSTWQYHILDSLKQEGSFQNQAFFEFQKTMAEFNNRGRQLRVEKKFHERKNDTESLENVKKQQSQLEEDRKHYYDSISSMFEGVLLGDIVKALVPVKAPPEIKAKQGMYPEEYFNWYKQHFFDNVNFSEPGVFNTPEYIFHRKLQQYCRYFLNRDPQNKEEIKNDIDGLLKKASASEAGHRYVISTLVDLYDNPEVIGMDWVLVYLYDEYFSKNKVPWAADSLVSVIENKVEQRRHNLTGKKAAHFRLPDEDNSYHKPVVPGAEFTILWFWDTDCDICIKRSKQLHEVYDDLKKKNAEVIAVYYDNNHKDWQYHIDQHGFDWINLWNPHDEFDLYKNYGLHKTPRMFILDENGIIKAKDINPDRLLKTLEYFDTLDPSLKQEFQFNSPKIQNWE
ncbi:MAG: thioredoxin-like domain-containing protein [Bacteroidales bacterium]